MHVDGVEQGAIHSAERSARIEDLARIQFQAGRGLDRGPATHEVLQLHQVHDGLPETIAHRGRVRPTEEAAIGAGDLATAVQINAAAALGIAADDVVQLPELDGALRPVSVADSVDGQCHEAVLRQAGGSQGGN